MSTEQPALPDWNLRRGMVVVFSGPSGVGKDTVLDALLKRDERIRRCITATTRAPRPGEVDGRDYLFRTPEQFKELMDQGYFLEWAHVHTDWYGTPVSGVEALNAEGFDVILKIDVQGCAAVVERMPEIVTIFLAPPSLEELSRRRQGRHTETEEGLEKRRQDALREMACLRTYQYVVVNHQVDQAVEDTFSILRAERLRVSRLKSL